MNKDCFGRKSKGQGLMFQKPQLKDVAEKVKKLMKEIIQGSI